MTAVNKNSPSAATEALIAAGDHAQAVDIAALENAADGAQAKLKTTKRSLVERMIFDQPPSIDELCSGVKHMLGSDQVVEKTIVETSLGLLASGKAFTSDNKISKGLRDAVSKDGAYGFTVPTEYGGLGLSYTELARLEENLAANGMGSLAVEISGQLTIGSSAILGYGSEQQRSTFLPLISDGNLIAFALTEVGVGVNARRVKAWVEKDETSACWRLNAEGACNKLYITSATHGGLAAIVARKGKDSNELGLFIVELPESDLDGEVSFECASSNVTAFGQNINSRISFRNFPIPFEQEIEGNGVEVLFYCLRLGRCMLAAMCSGFQKMMAADALSYATQRVGVGGKVIKHELPQYGIAKMLGGALTAQSLAFLALAQDDEGVDLAGLRDITKSASARSAMESLIACERVIGGRSLDANSRITEARPTIHAFGIVEGEDDLIRLGAVKDLTAKFTKDYMQGLLSVLQRLNLDQDGKQVAEEKRIYRLGARSLKEHPIRTLKAMGLLFFNTGFWKLIAWCIKNVAQDVLRSPLRLVPASWLPRYKKMPKRMANYLRYSEQGLRGCRWIYLLFNAVYQLELTWAQIPMQRLGMRIELLTAMAAINCHASKLDKSVQNIAVFQSELIKNQLKQLSCVRGLSGISEIRNSLGHIAGDLENDRCSMLDGVAPQPFAHPWN